MSGIKPIFWFTIIGLFLLGILIYGIINWDIVFTMGSLMGLFFDYVIIAREVARKEKEK